MISRSPPRWMTAAMALACLLDLSGCSLLHGTEPGTAARSKPVTLVAKAPAEHLVQFGFGRTAHFARCTEPVCPSRTLKTLATSTPTDTTAAQAASVPAEVSASRSGEGILSSARVDTPQVIVLRFPRNSSTLTPAHKSLLSRTAPALSQSSRILILGRTDGAGTRGTNQALAVARAMAVRNHLRHIVPTAPDDIRIDARGSCCYAATNDTSKGRAQNRRVEVVLLPAEEGPP